MGILISEIRKANKAVEKEFDEKLDWNFWKGKTEVLAVSTPKGHSIYFNEDYTFNCVMKNVFVDIKWKLPDIKINGIKHTAIYIDELNTTTGFFENQIKKYNNQSKEIKILKSGYISDETKS